MNLSCGISPAAAHTAKKIRTPIATYTTILVDKFDTSQLKRSSKRRKNRGTCFCCFPFKYPNGSHWPRRPLPQAPAVKAEVIVAEPTKERRTSSSSTRTVVAPGCDYESGIRRRAKRGLLSKTAKQPRRQIRRHYGLQNEPNFVRIAEGRFKRSFQPKSALAGVCPVFADAPEEKARCPATALCPIVMSQNESA